VTDVDRPQREVAPALARVAWPLRIGVGVALAAAGGIPLFGPRWTPWLVGLLALALGWAGWHLWWATRGPGAVLVGLERRWLGLHGARPIGGCAVHVHDGTQPLRIQLARQARTLVAHVATPLPASTLAFRLWPVDAGEAPEFTGSATRELTYDLARAHEVEALFSMLFHAEANEPRLLHRIMTSEVLAPLLLVRKESPPGAFRGITWDGRELAIHWTGPLVTDPERALQLSRPIWRSFVDGA
jgi:hypothetical protein